MNYHPSKQAVEFVLAVSKIYPSWDSLSYCRCLHAIGTLTEGRSEKVGRHPPETWLVYPMLEVHFQPGQD